MTNNQSVFRITKTQIGNTLYIVKTMPSERATETAQQRLISLVRDRIAANMKGSGKPVFIGQKPC